MFQYNIRGSFCNRGADFFDLIVGQYDKKPEHLKDIRKEEG